MVIADVDVECFCCKRIIFKADICNTASVSQ